MSFMDSTSGANVSSSVSANNLQTEMNVAKGKSLRSAVWKEFSRTITESGRAFKPSYPTTETFNLKDDVFGISIFMSNKESGVLGSNSVPLTAKANFMMLDAFEDEYGGMVIKSECLPADVNTFASLLRTSLHHWKLKVATLIAVYASWSFAAIEGIGWGWAGVVWLYNVIFYFPLDLIKFIIRYALSGRAWDLVLEKRIAFTRQKDFGKEARELKWAHAQRTLHGLQPPDTKMFGDRSSFVDLNQMAEESKRRAEIASPC